MIQSMGSHTPDQDQTHLQKQLNLCLNCVLVTIIKKLCTVAYKSHTSISEWKLYRASRPTYRPEARKLSRELHSADCFSNGQSVLREL